jgi:hypothetical protein
MKPGLLATVLLLASPVALAAPAIDADVCQWMVTYQPDAAGGADYKPGVDVEGRPVVEADINPSPAAVPSVIRFGLTADMAQQIGIDTAGFEGAALIGQIEMDMNGHMTFNGQPMEGEAEAALRAMCSPADSHNE